MAQTFVFVPFGNIRNFEREPDNINGLEHNYEEDESFDVALRGLLQSVEDEIQRSPGIVRIVWSKRKLSWSDSSRDFLMGKDRLREIEAYREDAPAGPPPSVRIGRLKRRFRGDASRNQLRNVRENDVVHIVGHGTWNSRYIVRKEQVGGRTTLYAISSSTVAQMLQDCGLRKTHEWFKVDSCLGGGLSAYKHVNDDFLYGVDTFASSLAMDLHAQGYADAKVGGYPYSIDTSSLRLVPSIKWLHFRVTDEATNDETEVEFHAALHPYLPTTPLNFDLLGAPPVNLLVSNYWELNAASDVWKRQVDFLSTDPYRWWYGGTGTRLRAPLPDPGAGKRITPTVQLPGYEELLRQEQQLGEDNGRDALLALQFPSRDRRPFLEGLPGGLLREVAEGSHVRYVIDNDSNLFRKERVGRGDRTHVVVGYRGTFKVKIEASDRPTVRWTIGYRVFDRVDAPGLEFVHVCRSGTEKNVALGPPLLTVEDIRRTEQNFGYRVDRPKKLDPYDNQRTMDYSVARDVPADFRDSNDIYFVPSVDVIVARPTVDYQVALYRYEAMTVVLDIKGEILDVLEWGAEIERETDPPKHVAECVVYKPTLLADSRALGDRYLASSADGRRRGLLLAMAFWNRFYYTLVRAGRGDARFSYLVDDPLDADDPLLRSELGVRVVRIDGEGEYWVADIDSPVQLPVRVRARRVSAFPQYPPAPLLAGVGVGALAYRIDAEALLLAVENLRLKSKQVCPRRHELWKLAMERLEVENSRLPRPKQIRDVNVVEEIVTALAKGFDSAADAASRTLLAPPDDGYKDAIVNWFRLQERELKFPQLLADLEEDRHHIGFDATTAIEPILAEHEMKSVAEIATRIRDASATAVVAMIDDIWTLYASSWGETPSQVGPKVQNNVPRWFSHLPSLMSEFFVRTRDMVDPLEVQGAYGPRMTPLPSAVPGGFTTHHIGFLVDLRDWDELKRMRGIDPSVLTGVGARRRADTAGAVEGGAWLQGTMYGSGRPLWIRETLELDYQTAVVVTRSPAGVFEQAEANETNYLYAVETPNEGFDLEAAQGMLAYLYDEPQRIARSGEKAFPHIDLDGILARRTLETSQTAEQDAEESGAEFYLMSREWEFPNVARASVDLKRYLKDAIPPPVLPVPLACFAPWAPSFLAARDAGGAPLRSLGAVVGVPDHVWQDEKLAVVWKLAEQEGHIDPRGMLQVREEEPKVHAGEQRYFMGDEEMRESPDDVSFAIVGKSPSVAVVGNGSGSFRGHAQYWKKLNAMFDPEEALYAGKRSLMRWPVSSPMEPRGFVRRGIGYVAFDARMSTDDAIVAPWLQDKGRPRRLERNSIVFYEDGVVPVPDSCLMVSRTLEGAVISAHFAARSHVREEDEQDLTIAAVQFAPGDFGLDLEALQMDALQQEDMPYLPGVKLFLDQIPAKMLLGTLKVTILPEMAPEPYTKVVDWTAAMAPVEMPVMFHWRAWGDWEFRRGTLEASKTYVLSSLPKTWLPSFPFVNGRCSLDGVSLSLFD